MWRKTAVLYHTSTVQYIPALGLYFAVAQWAPISLQLSTVVIKRYQTVAEISHPMTDAAVF
jgi:hypothetical protein